MKDGLAGKIAKGFISSKLTVLLMIVFMVIGVYSSFLIPREEEPQIDVPMADIFVGYPGASPTEVESRITKPLEKIISNIKGVEYVYTTSMQEQGMAIVQFYVGEDIERSLVRLYDEINKHMDEISLGQNLLVQFGTEGHQWVCGRHSRMRHSDLWQENGIGEPIIIFRHLGFLLGNLYTGVGLLHLGQDIR